MKLHRSSAPSSRAGAGFAGLVLPLGLVIAGFAASCAVGSDTPMPDVGSTISCTLESGRSFQGQVEDVAPGAVKVGNVWVDWDRVEFWHPAKD
jgi:hypothetical protein